ncbi:2-C-methyl-D-erythritol 4-phosphate cytidylyltransferase [uncultured Duncaniella sp.]|uniref:2-C-methyl-D-erythritol 4-phosphate cytidylyltransferase n=1 Tax=uncultured Duncaniella sp. TaxID=2768039 RepID=UPI0026003D65|nr:2-C-methyl-D-erythritol 4-phosphate cytidylyltransferase [uncultured Duncaniella sp.]
MSPHYYNSTPLSQTDNVHIVVAAGSGSRYGGNLPKQFCDLAGRPLLMTTLERLHSSTPEWKLIVVLSADMTGEWLEMCKDHSFTLPHTIVTGGATRAHSVKNALSVIPHDSTSLISIHDAARPVVTQALISAIVDGVEGCDGALPACAVTDSIRLVGADGSSSAVDRSTLRAVQTPQIFPADKLLKAYGQELLPVFTDDASVMEAAGYTNLRLVNGDPHNIKVTNPGDMAIAELYLSLI